jgi:DNA-binding IclR family transcriptional regulator
MVEMGSLLKVKHRVLLEITSNPNGYTLGELVDRLNLPKKQIASSIGELESYGMIKGLWERRELDNRWVWKYYMVGDGDTQTSELVDVLKQVKNKEDTDLTGQK